MDIRSLRSRKANADWVQARGGASRLALLVVPALSVVLAAGSAKPASATTTINCTANSGALGGALASANDGDTLAIQGTCKGTFDIAHSLTLLGSPGATLDGQEAGPVLTVDVGKTVSVDNLAITNGKGGTAGGILNNGNLTITNSTVSGNSATPGTSPNFGGGGIFNQGGALTLTNSTVSENSASVGSVRNGVGGILSLGGSLTLTSSTVSGNSATSSVSFSTVVGGISMGGFTGPASLTLTGTTVSGNSASALSDAFGGILASAPGAHVTATNSTVSGNSASATGGTGAFSSAVGGISNSGGSLSLISVTLAGNSVSEPNGGFLPPIGGVSNFFGGTLIAQNSLVAGQSGGPNCFGLAASSDGGYNLDDGTSCGFSSANHSLSNTNPMLDPAGLKDNGGPTQTIALLLGSPPIDAIPPGVNGCGTTITSDQRSVNRPQDAGCDIGAFELVRDTTPPVITVPGPITTNATSPAGAAVSYSVSATDPDDAVASLSCVPASGSTFPIGTTTVTCTATDTHGNSATASFSVHVEGAVEQLADLGDAVTGVGPGTSLADKVKQAQTFVARNDLPDACSTLTAFVNEVEAQSGKKIPPEQAVALIASSNRIKAVLGC